MRSASSISGFITASRPKRTDNGEGERAVAVAYAICLLAPSCSRTLQAFRLPVPLLLCLRAIAKMVFPQVDCATDSGFGEYVQLLDEVVLAAGDQASDVGVLGIASVVPAIRAEAGKRLERNRVGQAADAEGVRGLCSARRSSESAIDASSGAEVAAAAALREAQSRLQRRLRQGTPRRNAGIQARRITTGVLAGRRRDSLDQDDPLPVALPGRPPWSRQRLAAAHRADHVSVRRCSVARTALP